MITPLDTGEDDDRGYAGLSNGLSNGLVSSMEVDIESGNGGYATRSAAASQYARIRVEASAGGDYIGEEEDDDEWIGTDNLDEFFSNVVSVKQHCQRWGA